MKRMIAFVGAMLAVLLFGAGPVAADPAGIVDRANLFGARNGEVQSALDDFESRTSMTGTIATANGIGTQDIRSYATTAGAVLGRDQGEAVAIGIDMQTRAVGVYTTPSAMTRIPDAEITRIIDAVITPGLRSGDNVRGVVDGLRALADVATRVAATSTPAPDPMPAAGGGPTIAVYPGSGNSLGSYPYPGNWQSSQSTSSESGPIGIFVGFFVLVAAAAVVSSVVSRSRAATADTPEMRARLAGLVAAGPAFVSWSDRQRYHYARRHTGVPLGTWNAVYPQWHVRESSSEPSAGGFHGGGGSSLSFSSGGGGSSSSSSGGFSGGGGSSGSF